MTNWGPVNMLATHLDPKSADVKICPLVKSYIFGLFTGSTSSKSENQVKWCHHWIGLEKLPQKTPQMLKTVQWFKSYIFHLFRGHTASKSEIWSNLMSPLDWPQKHTPNRLLKCWNSSTALKKKNTYLTTRVITEWFLPKITWEKQGRCHLTIYKYWSDINMFAPERNLV